MEKNNKRDLFLKIRVSQEEMDVINHKFQNSGMKSKSDFIRAMIFQGYIVNIDENELKAIQRTMNGIAININQIAVRVNSTGNAYESDINEIKKGLNQIWQPLRFFQSQLLKLKR